MIENFEKIKEYVLTLGSFSVTPLLEIQIMAIIDDCLAYCYREDVPEQMELPLAQVIVNEINKRGLVAIDGDISSYSEGDLSISFNSSNSESKTLYNGKLEPFKKIGVIKYV